MSTSIEVISKAKRSRQIIFGAFLILLSILLFISFTSFFYNWKIDQTSLLSLTDRSVEASNLLKKLGAFISNFFIYNLFGFSSYIISFLFLKTGLILFLGRNSTNLFNDWLWGLYYINWFSILFGFFYDYYPILGGIVGFEISSFIIDYIGKIGFICVLVFTGIFFLVFHWKLTPELIFKKFSSKNIDAQNNQENTNNFKSPDSSEKIENNQIQYSNKTISSLNEIKEEEEDEEEELSLKINELKEEEKIENISQELVKKMGMYDPKLDLSSFRFPSIEILKDYGDGGITINEEELEVNKNRIVETLKNYKIEIAQIKANIGPTVTLYEIVPAAGIRISKIKNLEDDIALSLAALGIRIIAPIPGKGTIGIEVPNQNPTIVSIRSVLSF